MINLINLKISLNKHLIHVLEIKVNYSVRDNQIQGYECVLNYFTRSNFYLLCNQRLLDQVSSLSYLSLSTRNYIYRFRPSYTITATHYSKRKQQDGARQSNVIPYRFQRQSKRRLNFQPDTHLPSHGIQREGVVASETCCCERSLCDEMDLSDINDENQKKIRKKSIRVTLCMGFALFRHTLIVEVGCVDSEKRNLQTNDVGDLFEAYSALCTRINAIFLI